MFGSSGAHDLGYANAAILIALMRKLIANGVITKDQGAEVLEDAVNILGPHGHVTSIGAAIRMINTDVKLQVAA
jgi:hypothetical protein